MAKTYIEDKDFEGVDFCEEGLTRGTYENCTFNNCLLANTDLSEIVFLECEFKNCDLSMAKTPGTAFREVIFKSCKLLGLHFDDCNDFLFSVEFDGCLLNLSSFFKRSMKNKTFRNCSLQEVDFVEADLSNATFENCDLMGATFQNTILEKADFRSAINYSIDPEGNRIKKAKFSLTGVSGLLDKYNLEIT